MPEAIAAPRDDAAPATTPAAGILRAATVVTLEAPSHLAIPAVVHRLAGARLRVELLASAASTVLAPGTSVAVDAAADGEVLRFPAAVVSLAAFPAVDLDLDGAAERRGAAQGARIALAFPVRYEVLPAAAGAIAARVRARVDAAADAARAAGDPSEVALLALAKMMARLDARFDRVLAQRGRDVTTAADADGDDPHAVLVFSLAKMMLTRLDEKFDRLLAAMRDADVLGRPLLEHEERGGAFGAPSSPHLMVLHALTRLMDSLGEKFERVVAAIDRPGDGLRLESAWGLAVGEGGVTLGAATPIATGAILDLELRLPLFPAVPLLAFARVDEVDEHPDDVPERRWRASASFVALPEADRDLVVQLVLRKQREQLRARHDHDARA